MLYINICETVHTLILLCRFFLKKKDELIYIFFLGFNIFLAINLIFDITR